jgi:sigma-54 specific flagellar transcriptional regulator A
MVSRGEFREDLYYRLRGVVLEVPPLRERVTDLPLIADAILERIADERGSRVKRLASRALNALCRHSWPGNVRELENVLRAAVLFAEGDFIEVHDLHDDLRDPRNLRDPRGLAPVAPASGAVRALPPTDDEAPSTVGHVNPSAGVYTLRPDEITTDSANDDGSAASGTGLATSDVAMSQTSKIAQLGPADGVSATEVAYAAIRAGVSLSELKRDIERDCIARALAETGGNITRAAGLLGMKRPRLSQLVKQYGFGSGGAPIDEADAEDDE